MLPAQPAGRRTRPQGDQALDEGLPGFRQESQQVCFRGACQARFVQTQVGGNDGREDGRTGAGWQFGLWRWPHARRYAAIVALVCGWSGCMTYLKGYSATA